MAHPDSQSSAPQAIRATLITSPNRNRPSGLLSRRRSATGCDCDSAIRLCVHHLKGSWPSARSFRPRGPPERRARHDGAHDESAQRFSGAVRGYGKANATSISAILPIVLSRARLPVADFDGSGHQRLVVDAPALAACLSANIGFVHLDMFARRATDPVLIGSHHGGTQLVQDAEGRLVAGQAELPLELHRRHAWRLTGDQIGSPKPCAERHMAPLHHRANQKAGLATARAALKNAGPSDDAEGLADRTAIPAGKAIRPAGEFKISRARRVIGKLLLELGKRSGERQVVTLEDVHGGHEASRSFCSETNTTPGGCLRQPDRHASIISILAWRSRR